MKKIFLIAILSLIFSCKIEKKFQKTDNKTKSLAVNSKTDSKEFYKKQVTNAVNQLSLLLNDSEKAGKNPRTIDKNGEIHWTHEKFDWTEGFFPGSLWYIYKYTNDKKYKKGAEEIQKNFEKHKLLKTNHDLGFVFNNSYGNGYKLTKNKEYKDVLVAAANSLITRYNKDVGCIKSWDVDRGWQSKRNWKFPVIIDNMMNLELLFEVSKLTDDNKYKEIAIHHANTTLKNHFRSDYSSYHVIDYDPETGEVRGKQTAQGFADSSAWARGQAWGIYGYTVCYRYTKDEKYLKQAEKIADFIINHKDLPEDGIPYWDFSENRSYKNLRDVSAATVTLSALIELEEYSKKDYSNYINKVFKSLASSQYTAALGENKNFVLKHSVGSIPHNNEIDVPLNYADYYYLEALSRKLNIK